MKASLYIGRYWLNAGWYSGNPFKIFCLTIGERVPDYPAIKWYRDSWALIEIQFLYLLFSFGINAKYPKAPSHD
jgi:hypothetical protein